jgi:hypothetical protein
MNKFRFILSVTVISLVLMATIVFLLTAPTLSSAKPTELDYFKGNWTVTLRNNPTQSFNWKVTEDLDQSWLSGVVEQNSKKISTDFWRLRDKKIERFAFTGNSAFCQNRKFGLGSG